MPDRYRVNFTLDAASQLQEIFDYIQRDSPQGAERMIQRLVAAIDSLDVFPHRYKILEDVETFGVEVRSMPVPPYLIRYHVEDRNLLVTVLSIRHGARRPGL
jgi:toxin ParE1/3/4